MKKSAIIAVGVSVALVVGSGVGWFFYQRHLQDQLTMQCFNGTHPDACFSLAVIAFKGGQISEMDRLVRQHCYQRYGIESGNSPSIAGAGLCVVSVSRQVEASGLK